MRTSAHDRDLHGRRGIANNPGRIAPGWHWPLAIAGAPIEDKARAVQLIANGRAVTLAPRRTTLSLIVKLPAATRDADGKFLKAMCEGGSIADPTRFAIASTTHAVTVMAAATRYAEDFQIPLTTQQSETLRLFANIASTFYMLQGWATTCHVPHCPAPTVPDVRNRFCNWHLVLYLRRQLLNDGPTWNPGCWCWRVPGVPVPHIDSEDRLIFRGHSFPDTLPCGRCETDLQAYERYVRRIAGSNDGRYLWHWIDSTLGPDSPL